jgi:alkylation response protein AidB-like acyl-CoA dehydrogenase
LDFDFTPEQVMLREVARELLAEKSSPAEVRKLAESPLGHQWSEPLWQQLAEVGLHGVTVDEQHGGQGLGLVEQAIILEEIGRAVMPGPYLPTILATAAIRAGGDRSQQATYLPKIASGQLKATVAVLEDRLSWSPDAIQLRPQSRGGELRLTGRKLFVPWASAADLILVAVRTRVSGDPERGITIFAVPRDAPGVTFTPNQSFDETCKTDTVDFDDVQLGRESAVGQLDEGWSVLRTVLQWASVGAAAEMLGSARKSMEMSVEYAKVREQFGQPIGAFQAIKHACAEMFVEVENGHAATYYAAWALDANAPDADLAAAVAKYYVGEAARKVCGSAIQVHGGIGFTWDYDLHLYFKRAKTLEVLYGDAEHHRELALRAALQPQSVEVPA